MEWSEKYTVYFLSLWFFSSQRSALSVLNFASFFVMWNLPLLWERIRFKVAKCTLFPIYFLFMAFEIVSSTIECNKLNILKHCNRRDKSTYTHTFYIIELIGMWWIHDLVRFCDVLLCKQVIKSFVSLSVCKLQT